MAGSFPTGRFIWYELLTRDPEAAKAFYLPLAGWSEDVWEGGAEPYTMWVNGQRPMGGLMALPDEAAAQGAPSHWLPYLATPNVDETLSKALARGAHLLAGIITVPSVGRMAVLKDPQGAVFAAYTPEAAPPDGEDAPSIGDFSWHELLTTDPVAAFDFYHTLFGWEKTESVDMGEMGVYQMYGRSAEGPSLGGIYKIPPGVPAPPHWLLYIRVKDIHRAVRLVTDNGGRVMNGPEEVPGGDLVAQCMDPQGAAFALHAVAARE